jgi:hypothetical protein
LQNKTRNWRKTGCAAIWELVDLLLTASLEFGFDPGVCGQASAQALHASSFLFNDLAFLVIPRKSLKFLTLLFSIPTAQAAFLLPHCTASTVSLSPIALVTATSVDRRGLPCTDNAR